MHSTASTGCLIPTLHSNISECDNILVAEHFQQPNLTQSRNGELAGLASRECFANIHHPFHYA